MQCLFVEVKNVVLRIDMVSDFRCLMVMWSEVSNYCLKLTTQGERKAKASSPFSGFTPCKHVPRICLSSSFVILWYPLLLFELIPARWHIQCLLFIHGFGFTHLRKIINIKIIV